MSIGNIIETANILKLMASLDALLNRSANQPAMAIIYGDPGMGKSTAANWLAIHKRAVVVRARFKTTRSALLDWIAAEMGAGELKFSNYSRMLDWIIADFRRNKRPLVIDESDFIIESKLVEVLRDIHDLSGAPVYMIGMSAFDSKIKNYPQIDSRIGARHKIHFGAAKMADAAALATKMMGDIRCTEDAIALVLQRCEGNMRIMDTTFEAIHAAAVASDCHVVDVDMVRDLVISR